MLKTQKCVHDMFVGLDLPLPNEERPGLQGLNYNLLRDLVSEESAEFDIAMQALQLLQSESVVDARETAVWLCMLQKLTDAEIQRYREMTSAEFHHEATLYWWAEVIDGICDTIVVLHNTSNAMGVDIEPFFDEVHRANMTKADGPLRADGKRLKPPDFQPPRIEQMLRNLLETGEAKP